MEEPPVFSTNLMYDIVDVAFHYITYCIINLSKVI